MARIVVAVVALTLAACTSDDLDDEQAQADRLERLTALDEQHSTEAPEISQPVDPDDGAGDGLDADAAGGEDNDPPDHTPADGDNEDDDGWRPMTPEEAEAWRAPGGAGELFGPAARNDELVFDAHKVWWIRFRPGGIEFPDWEWSNKDQLWDEMSEAIWADATERFGTRLRDRPGTVFPGANTSATAIWTWAKHTDGPRGWVGVAHVGIEPEDPAQARPDVGVYFVQIHVTETEEPTLFEGRLHRVTDPFVFAGESPSGDQGDLRAAIRDAAMARGQGPPLEPINPEFDGEERS